MINEFLSELSDLLKKYNYSIVAEKPTSGGLTTVNIKTTHPHLETLYTNDLLIDKDTIPRYFLTELEWKPIFEPVGKVKFLGKDISVPNESGWVAMNKNGSVFYFTEEPTIKYDMYYSSEGREKYLGVMDGVKKPDAWKKSLMYFNLSENENETV